MTSKGKGGAGESIKKKGPTVQEMPVNLLTLAVATLLFSRFCSAGASVMISAFLSRIVSGTSLLSRGVEPSGPKGRRGYPVIANTLSAMWRASSVWGES